MIRINTLNMSQTPVELLAVVEIAAHPLPMSLTMLQSCCGGRYRHWGAWDGDQLIGFLIGEWVLDEATLINIAVMPDYQGQGVGKRLLGQFLSWAEEQFCRQVLLEVRVSNKGAIGLYQSFGFERIGVRKGYYPAVDGREDAWVMSVCQPFL